MLRAGQRRIPGSKKRTSDLRQFKTAAVAEVGGALLNGALETAGTEQGLAQEEDTHRVPTPTGGREVGFSISVSRHPPC